MILSTPHAPHHGRRQYATAPDTNAVARVAAVIPSAPIIARERTGGLLSMRRSRKPNAAAQLSNPARCARRHCILSPRKTLESAHLGSGPRVDPICARGVGRIPIRTGPTLALIALRQTGGRSARYYLPRPRNQAATGLGRAIESALSRAFARIQQSQASYKNRADCIA